VSAVASILRLPRPLVEVWDWQRRAACRNLDSSMFFHPDGERGPRRAQREERAKAICAGCPVRAECLEHSLRVQEPYGIWGGVSETERPQLRRALAAGHDRRAPAVVEGSVRNPLPPPS
jgi:WhiB family transcriptional regulator, redox-sensing transcriptional regulator